MSRPKPRSLWLVLSLAGCASSSPQPPVTAAPPTTPTAAPVAPVAPPPVLVDAEPVAAEMVPPPAPAAAPVMPPNSEEPIDQWSGSHAETAGALGEWVKAHPAAARLVFEWDGKHPERSREFVMWALAHPGEGVDDFVRQHPRWPVFDRLIKSHKPATEAFLAWARRHPPGAEALMRHARGLQWVGYHLYSGSWEMPKQ